MAENKYSLPIRKWYTLEQAVKRIKQLTGEDLEIIDIIHHWLNNKINIATNISFSSSKIEPFPYDNELGFTLKEEPAEEFFIGNNKFNMNELTSYRNTKVTRETNKFVYDDEDSYFFKNDDFLYSGVEIGSNDFIMNNKGKHPTYEYNIEIKEQEKFLENIKELVSANNESIKNININIIDHSGTSKLFNMNVDFIKTLSSVYLIDSDDSSDEEKDIMNFSTYKLKGLVYLSLAGNIKYGNHQFYSLEGSIIKNGYISSKLGFQFFQYDKKKGVYIHFQIHTKNEYKIDIENLYVTEDAINTFLSGKEAFTIPNTEKEQTMNPKTLNRQAQTIRDLITIFYGEEVANNIRRYLDDPNSEISRDFDEKGLIAPSGKTVNKWIN